MLLKSIIISHGFARNAFCIRKVWQLLEVVYLEKKLLLSRRVCYFIELNNFGIRIIYPFYHRQDSIEPANLRARNRKKDKISHGQSWCRARFDYKATLMNETKFFKHTLKVVYSILCRFIFVHLYKPKNVKCIFIIFFFQIRNCETFYIPSQMFKELVNLDYFSFEGEP